MKKIFILLIVCLLYPCFINALEKDTLYLEEKDCKYNVDYNDYIKDKIFDRSIIDNTYLKNNPNVFVEENFKYLPYNNAGLNYIYLNNIKLDEDNTKSIIIKSFKVFINDKEVGYNLYQTKNESNKDQFVNSHKNLELFDNSMFSISVYESFKENEVRVEYEIENAKYIKSLDIEFRYDYLSPIFTKKVNTLNSKGILTHDDSFIYTNKIVKKNYTYYKKLYKCSENIIDEFDTNESMIDNFEKQNNIEFITTLEKDNKNEVLDNDVIDKKESKKLKKENVKRLNYKKAKKSKEKNNIQDLKLVNENKKSFLSHISNINKYLKYYLFFTSLLIVFVLAQLFFVKKCRTK